MKILIAGLGSIGGRHLRNLTHLGMDDFILWRTHDAPHPDGPQWPVFTDLADALAQKPAAVIVCTPTAQHLEIALPAAEAGLALFLEKPVSHTWAGVNQLLQQVQAKNLKTYVGFDLRFDPGLQKAQTLLASGQMGRLVAIQAQVGQYLPDWRPWQDYRLGMSAQTATGGGVILDLIHELDYVTWLAGPVNQVACFAGNPSSLQLETEAVAAINLQFESGAIGAVQLDYIQRTPTRTCRIICENGSIFWDYFNTKLSWYLVETGEWQTLDFSSFDRNDRFVMEMQHFLDYLADKVEPKVDLPAGAAVLRLALAAKESAATQRIVNLAEYGPF